jgi:hypothetical protein
MFTQQRNCISALLKRKNRVMNPNVPKNLTGSG